MENNIQPFPSSFSESEEIEVIKSYAVNESMTRKFYTNVDIHTYHNVELKSVAEEIPSGNLISYQREIIRKGRQLIMMKGAKGKITYTHNDSKKIELCERYEVSKHDTDVLLINFEDYENNKLTSTIRRKEILKEKGIDLESSLDIKETGTFATIINYSEKNEKEIVETNKIGFKNEMSHEVKIARLAKGNYFYRIGKAKENEAKKIITSTGKDAILLTSFENFNRVQSGLERFMVGLVICIFLALIIVPSFFLLVNTGWIIFIGVIFIPVGIFIAQLIVVPIYLIVEAIIKRF